MVYYIYLFILSIISIIILYEATKVRAERGTYLRILSHLIYISFAACAFFIAATYITIPIVSTIGFVAYHALNTWRNLYFLLFAIAYVKSTPLSGKAFWLCIILCVADNIYLICHNILHYGALYSNTPFGSGHISSISNHGHYLHHMVVSILFILMFLIVLARHFIIDPTIYKMQFAWLIVVMAVTIGINIVFIGMELPIDFSAIIFGILAISLRYLTEGFIAKSLIRDMNIQMLSNSNAAILLFGEHGRCLYINDNARKLFPGMEVTMERSFFEENYFKNSDIASISGKTIYFNEETTEESCFLFDFSELHDKKGRYEGCYFMLTDLTKEEKQKREKLLMVSRDIITGLLNEAGFYEKVERIVSRRTDVEYKIILTNITNFKLINEMLGRKKGDEILSEIGRVLSQYVNRDVAASRMDADHFALFIESDFDEKALADQINSYLRKTSPSLSTECHFGIYVITDFTLPITLMYENANLSLASLNPEEQEHIAYYNDILKDTILSKNELIAEMIPGLEQHQFELYFQPQVDSFSEKVVGAEALVRWNHPTRGFLTPYHFIDLFEQSGHLYELDSYVWEEACKTLRDLRDMGYPISISVNISQKDIFNHDLHAEFLSLIKKYGVNPKNFKLEITESAVIADVDLLKELVKKLQDSGFVVEMDDFGSGYSSLNSLKDIPVDIIKTDRLFMKDTEQKGRSRFIFDSILGLARKLETPIICEGCETEEQLEYLRSIGCHNVQGFYYAKPLPLDEFIKFMDEHGVDDIKI